MFQRVRSFLVFFALAALGLSAGASVAAPRAAQPVLCTALAPEAISPAQIARDWAPQASRWNCSGAHWPIDGSRATLVRITVPRAGVADGAMLATRLTRYHGLSITAVARDGRFATRDIAPSDLTFSTTGWTMRMRLPRLTAPVEAYVVKVTGARHPGLLSDIAIAPPPDEARVGNAELLLAALCGLMLMPLILSFLFFRILRQRFILWHAAAVLAMLVQTLVTCGLVNRFATLSLYQINLLSTLSWAAMVICAVRFFVNLLEPETVRPGHRMAISAITPWFLFWSGYYVLADGPLLPSVAPLYYMAFLPIIAVLVTTLIAAAMRGSRQVWFQIVGWSPLMLLGLARNATILGLGDAPMGLMLAQHLAIVFEIVVTTLGAADRIMAIRLQRDLAIDQVRVQSNLARHDALTGLLNRRAIEEQFPELYAAGFHTMAALDLDHFKAVNDTHGHAAGDEVLRAVASALRPDEDTIAVRMGGEEFLLLLRGDDALDRAERRRQAIPSRVAKHHPGLARLITASMGIYTHESEKADQPAPAFINVYTTCDRLLYASKEAGRNCVRSNAPLPASWPDTRPPIALAR